MNYSAPPLQEGLQWSQTHISPLSGRKTLDIALALGRDRTLAGSFNLDHINEIFQALDQANQLHFFVADNQGNLIFHPDQHLLRHPKTDSPILPLEKAIQGIYGSFTFEMDHREYFGSTAGIREVNWHVVVAQTRSAALGPLIEIRFYFGLALFFSLVLVAALALGTLGRLYQPLKNFQDSILELARGKYETALPRQDFFELEQLAVRFRKMAKAIKSREKALQLSEEKFRSIFDNAPLAVIHYDEEGIVNTCNDTAAQVFGIPVEKMIGFNGFDETSHPRLARATAAALAGEASRFTYTYDAPYFSRPRILNVNFGPIRTGDAAGGGAIGVFEDITAQLDMAERTRKSEEKFKVVFESANEGILVADLETGQIIMGNTRLAMMLDLRQDDLIGMDLADLFPKGSPLDRLTATDPNQLEDQGVIFEQPLTRADGTELMTEVNAGRIEVGEEEHFIGFFRDITQRISAEAEKKKLETQLRQAHKMEAIGTLAGGIAHDFNNLLGIIMGNLELARDDLPQWSPVKKYLDEIRTAGKRARDVVRQLLSFSRKTEQERTPVQMNEIVRESIRLLRASIPASVDLTTEMEDRMSAINGDPTQIQQIIINLCTNAVHAMDGRPGHIRIDVRELRLAKMTFKNFGTLPAGTYIRLTVADNGKGIPGEIIERVFDPYFTTKAVGKGTGLGLAVVHGIVVNHDGALSLYSEPGQGTEIRIFFPAVKAAPIITPELDRDIPSGRGCILLVDDEPSLVRTTLAMLERQGYTVMPFTHPQAALDAFKTAPEAVDLVLTDMTMPGMTGDVLAREIHRIRPDLPIILSTGFSHQLGPDAPLPQGVSMILEKPMNKRTLAKAIHQLISG